MWSWLLICFKWLKLLASFVEVYLPLFWLISIDDYRKGFSSEVLLPIARSRFALLILLSLQFGSEKRGLSIFSLLTYAVIGFKLFTSFFNCRGIEFLVMLPVACCARLKWPEIKFCFYWSNRLILEGSIISVCFFCLNMCWACYSFLFNEIGFRLSTDFLLDLEFV